MEAERENLLSLYVCPNDRSSLAISSDGLRSERGAYHPYLCGIDERIPDFRDMSLLGDSSRASLQMYDFEGAREIYRNFLSWLFRTFEIDGDEFRRDLVKRLRLKEGARVLVTGCGLGDEVKTIQAEIGSMGTVFASDLAPEMVVATHHALKEGPANGGQVSLSVADACKLPFPDDFFDAAFHFGGINLFDDVQLAISEMARVTKDGGRVVFGDEGIAPWLRGTEYGRMVIANNRLWACEAPLDMLPKSAINPAVSWILGNCFYIVEFEKDSSGPFINPDIPHVGRRGGTMRTRYHGQIEGVSPELKESVLRAAAEEKISVTAWLENAIGDALRR